jgi:tripartite-type tricarboxylate transporter receptor subunit TctC
VIAGQVKFFFSNGSSVVGMIQSGQVKAIAHTGKGRLKSLPDIPAVSETLPGFEAYEWNGVFVPHGTPRAIVDTLNGAINRAIASPDVKDRFEQLNIESRPTTPEQFRTFVHDQIERWGKVVKQANIKIG